MPKGFNWLGKQADFSVSKIDGESTCGTGRAQSSVSHAVVSFNAVQPTLLILVHGYLPNNPDIAAKTKAIATIAPAITASPDRNSRWAPKVGSVIFRARYFSTAKMQMHVPTTNRATGLNISVKSALRRNSNMGITTFLFMTFLYAARVNLSSKALSV